MEAGQSLQKHIITRLGFVHDFCLAQEDAPVVILSQKIPTRIPPDSKKKIIFLVQFKSAITSLHRFFNLGESVYTDVGDSR